MTRKNKSQAPRKAPAAPLSPLKAAGLWLIAAPAVVHLFGAFLLGGDADANLVVLLGVMLASVFSGLMVSGAGYDPLTTAAAVAWSPMLFTWRHWYWGMDMHSPGGSAQQLVAAFGWPGAPAPYAVGAVCVVCAWGGWIAAHAARGSGKRTAKKRLQDYGKPGHDARP